MVGKDFLELMIKILNIKNKAKNEISSKFFLIKKKFKNDIQSHRLGGKKVI